MLDLDWMTTGSTTLVSVLVSALGVYIALLVFTRLSGLRTFSKMSSFDFAVTVATGSILASTIISGSPALVTGVFALGVLFTLQYAVAKSRRLNAALRRLVDNTPLVLMAGAQSIAKNLDRARVTENDLYSKLRMAGITDRRQVLAVILETTGDFTVLEYRDEIDALLFEGVRDGDRVLAAHAQWQQRATRNPPA